MVKITFILPDGTEKIVGAAPGASVMEIAQQVGIDGVIAECGGSMACATCHCFFDDATISKIGPAEGNEDDMLDFAATPRTSNSRLSCQVAVTEELERVIVTVPESQV